MKKIKRKTIIIIMVLVIILFSIFIVTKLPQITFEIPEDHKISNAMISRLVKNVGEEAKITTYKTENEFEGSKLFEIGSFKIYNSYFQQGKSINQSDIYYYISFEFSDNGKQVIQEISFRVGSDEVESRFGEKQIAVFGDKNKLEQIQSKIENFFNELSANSKWNIQIQ